MNEKIMMSIIAPAYNESENINYFHKRITEVIDKMNITYEIVFIDDGSKDNTVELIKKLIQQDNRVKLVNLARNFGKEIAMTAGLDFCTGLTAIVIDVDLQDPPEIIPQLYEKWQEGYDVVYATRSVRKGETFLKKFTASMFYKVIGNLADIRIPANTGDFRLMDRCVIDAIKEVKETHRFMKGIFAWVGFKQIGIEYEREPRHLGKTKWNYWKLINFAIEGIASFSTTPLRLATYAGVLISFGAFGYAGYFFVRTILNSFLYHDPDFTVAGYPSLIISILFLGGMQLLTIGILGEYIGRIHNEVKKRPLYFVKEEIGFDDAKDKKLV